MQPALAVDIGGTKLAAALVDEDGRIVARAQAPTPREGVFDALVAVGVAADRVALAHIDRTPDAGLHAELAATGAYLGYDGPARAKDWPDSVLLDCLVATAAAGGADRIRLGGDVARRTRYLAYGGMPGLRYLGERFVPRLVAQGGADLADAVLRRNPAAWLTWRV